MPKKKEILKQNLIAKLEIGLMIEIMGIHMGRVKYNNAIAKPMKTMGRSLNNETNHFLGPNPLDTRHNIMNPLSKNLEFP